MTEGIGITPRNDLVFVRLQRPYAEYTGPLAMPDTGGKPISGMIQIVEDYSRQGDLVCDPVSGAGTTLLAALRTGRRCIGIEKDPGRTPARSSSSVESMPFCFLAITSRWASD